MLGILLIDKPIGISSHDVVNCLRRRFATKRIGHAGTLDPMATGLLVVAVGPATRFLQYLPLEPKVYEARITFGRTTTTYDSEDETGEIKPPPADLLEVACESVKGFVGLIEQVPPMYSAVKVKGKPLYRYARSGETLERESRRVHIEKFALSPTDQPETLGATIVCSGGTYVRSLAHDLGQAVGCGAYLSGLRRTQIGRFTIEEAVSLDEAAPAHLMALREALLPMPMLELEEPKAADIRMGRSIESPNETQGVLVALLESPGRVFSVARSNGNVLHPECVIPRECFDDPV